MLRLDLGLDLALDYIICLGTGLANIDRHRIGIYFHSSSKNELSISTMKQSSVNSNILTIKQSSNMPK